MLLGGFIIQPIFEDRNTLQDWLGWVAGTFGLSYEQYVPVITEYRVTRITRTIDDFLIQPNRFGGAQTISFYGNLIPEPGTLLGLTASLILLACRRPRRPNSRCPRYTCHCRL